MTARPLLLVVFLFSLWHGCLGCPDYAKTCSGSGEYSTYCCQQDQDCEAPNYCVDSSPSTATTSINVATVIIPVVVYGSITTAIVFVIRRRVRSRASLVYGIQPPEAVPLHCGCNSLLCGIFCPISIFILACPIDLDTQALLLRQQNPYLANPVQMMAAPIHQSITIVGGGGGGGWGTTSGPSTVQYVPQQQYYAPAAQQAAPPQGRMVWTERVVDPRTGRSSYIQTAM
jgi:hypothetical protein